MRQRVRFVDKAAEQVMPLGLTRVHPRDRSVKWRDGRLEMTDEELLVALWQGEREVLVRASCGEVLMLRFKPRGVSGISALLPPLCLGHANSEGTVRVFTAGSTATPRFGQTDEEVS
jgi:hypothetical protein